MGCALVASKAIVTVNLRQKCWPAQMTELNLIERNCCD